MGEINGITLAGFAVGAIVLVLGLFAIFKKHAPSVVVDARVISCEMFYEGQYRATLEYITQEGNTATVDKYYPHEVDIGSVVAIDYPEKIVLKQRNKLKNTIFLLVFVAAWMGFFVFVHIFTSGTDIKLQINAQKLFMLIIGVMFTFFGTYMAVDLFKKNKRIHQNPVAGTVIGSLYTDNAPVVMGRRKRYRGVAEYIDENGDAYEIRLETYYFTESEVPVGKTITLYKDPKSGEVSDGHNTSAFIVFGVVFAAAGLALISAIFG